MRASSMGSNNPSGIAHRQEFVQEEANQCSGHDKELCGPGQQALVGPEHAERSPPGGCQSLNGGSRAEQEQDETKRRSRIVTARMRPIRRVIQVQPLYSIYCRAGSDLQGEAILSMLLSKWARDWQHFA